MRSIVAAFTLLRQVQGERGEWAQLLELADAVIDRMQPARSKLFVAIQAGHIAFDKVNDIARAKKFFAIAAVDRAAEPERRRTSSQRVGLDEMPMAAGSMPAIPVADDAARARSERPRRKRGASRGKTRDEAAESASAAARGAAREAAASSRARGRREGCGGAAADARPLRRAGCRGREQAAAAARRARPRPTALLPSEGRGRRQAAAARQLPKAAAERGCRAAADARRSRRRDGEGQERRRSAPTRASASGRTSSPRTRPTQAPRRELARVLRNAQSWAQLADALKDEEAKAAPTPAREGRRVRSSSPRRTASSTTTTR